MRYPDFRVELEKVVAAQVGSLTLDVGGLVAMGSEGGRLLSFVFQKLSLDAPIVVTGANEEVRSLLARDELSEAVRLA